MAAPSFIQEAEVTDWGSAVTPRTGTSRSYLTGDVVIGIGGAENAGTPSAVTISGGSGFSWTTEKTQPAGSDSNKSFGRLFSAVIVGNQSFQPSFANPAGIFFGGNALTFRSSNGIGASASTDNGTSSGAPSLDITTTQANSALVVFVADWNGSDGSSRTWRTVNSITPSAGGGDEVSYFRDGSHYTIYGAYYSDVGAIGTKTVGLSAPSTQRYVILAIEVKGIGPGNLLVKN